MKTKIQIVTRAFNELRINGITVDADSEDNEMALYELEDIMSELQLDLGFKFEDEPYPNTITGLQRYATNPIAMLLAIRLAPRYGKLGDAYLMRSSSAMSSLFARVKRPRPVAYPTRQPFGRGNERRYPGYQFFPPSAEPADLIDTAAMELSDKKSFDFDFSPFLNDGEAIQSYTATPSKGVSIISQSFTDNVITLYITALSQAAQEIVFKVIGDGGTQVSRTMYFNVVTGEAVGAS